MYVLLLPSGNKGLKGVLKVFKEQSHEIRSVTPAVFYEKAVLKIFVKFLEHHLQQNAYWKLITMLNMSSVTNVFLGIFRKYSEQLFKRKPSDECSIFHLRTPPNECFWWGNTQKKNLVEANPPQSWPWKQNSTTVVAAVTILEIVNNWRCVLQTNILKKKLDFEP